MGDRTGCPIKVIVEKDLDVSWHGMSDDDIYERILEDLPDLVDGASWRVERSAATRLLGWTWMPPEERV